MGYVFEAIQRAKAMGQTTTVSPRPEGTAPTPILMGAPGSPSGGAGGAASGAASGGSPSADSMGYGDAKHGPILSDQEPIVLDTRRMQAIDERLVVLHDPSTHAAEEYRAIRTGLLARWQHQRHLAHAISSATPQEGKTLTSLNLAATLGELEDRRCVVVEADLRLPQFRYLLSLPDTPGLADVLRGDAPLAECLLPIAARNLWVLPAGRGAGEAAAQMLSGAAMTSVIDQLRRQFDHVIIDTPPVSVAADTGVLGAQCDEVILVARMGVTPAPMIQQAIQALSQAQAKVAGLIATENRATPTGMGYGYRHHRSAQLWRRAA